jgi:hypothetical protein
VADRFYTGVLGSNMPSGVTEGAAATPGNPFDFRVTYDATGVQKLDALKFLEACIGAIQGDTWPPV